MNVDMITTFLNDFSTFWKNIWKFLEPIFNLAQGTWKKPESGEDHLANLNEINKAFDGEGYTPAGSSEGADNVNTDVSADETGSESDAEAEGEAQ